MSTSRSGTPAFAPSSAVGDGGPPHLSPPLLPSLQSKEHREPVVSVSSIHVEENSGVVITNSSLRVLGLDAPENEIVLTVIRKPSYGENVRSQQNTDEHHLPAFTKSRKRIY